MKRFIVLSILILSLISGNATIKLSSLLTDNMVLQQDTKVKLSGEAIPNTQVIITASWQKAPIKVGADSDGNWQVRVSTPKASFNTHKITITNGKDRCVLSNVLIGEVWLASGQSNMEMPLEGFGGCCVKDGTHDAINASRTSPYVRMFNVKKSQSMHEQKYCEGTWLTTAFPEVMKFSATAYYYASALSNALQVPVGIVNASYGGAHVESWSPMDLIKTYPDIPTDSTGIYNFGSSDYDRPLLMYNAMFCPVKNYTYKGIIWYQGCSNLGHADVYPQRLKNMVDYWRKQIGEGDIPFYEVEIAPYEYGDGTTINGALIREAQMKATAIIPNSGIISTNDLVEPYERWNIHPSNKRTVGDRLAFLALNKNYGMSDIPCEGPKANLQSFRTIGASELPKEQQSLAQVTSVDGDSLKIAVIGFITNNKGVCRSFDLSGFEIAGADRVFHKTTAAFRWQTNEVFLVSPEVPEPVAIRYCFRDWQPGGLLGGNELPLFPFRTDNW